MIDWFLLGALATASLTASLFFFRFWRDTRDFLFLAFALAFLIEGVCRTSMLLARHPNEASPWIYLVRLLGFLLVLGAIVNKNRSPSA
jgi:uncharacterized membrane protein HdeD (DUF308 family)